MHTLLFKKKLYDAAVCLFLMAAITALVLFPSQSVGAAKDGLALCANVIIPSLFPFFVLSALIVESGLASKFGRLLDPVMRPLFNVGGGCSTAFVLGFVGGYPVGAKSVIALYDSGECSKNEAERMLAFCNNSGPAFILGVVGAGIFSSSKVGLILYLAHAAASVCVGVLFRNWKSSKSKTKAPEQKNTSKKIRESFPAAFVASVKSSFSSTLSICGFVIFFTVIITLLHLSGFIPFLAEILSKLFSPIGLDEKWAERLITGIIELSSGVWSLQGAANELRGSMAMAAFMLGWAGLSVHCQVLSFIGSSGLSVKTYIIGKILHGLLSSLFVYALSVVFVFDVPVASYLATQVSGIASVGFSAAFSISLLSATVLFAIFVVSSAFLSKHSGKRR